MLTRKSIGIGIAVAGLIGLGILACVVCGKDCPVFLTVIAAAPSGLIDDNGNEYRFLTVRINNTDSGMLTLAEDGIRAEVKVGEHWLPANCPSSVLDVGRYRDLLVLVPYNAEGCRLGIEYVPEPLSLRSIRACGRVGLRRFIWWRTMVVRWFPVRWLAPVRSDYVGTSPEWKHIMPEVLFFSGPGTRLDPQAGGVAGAQH